MKRIENREVRTWDRDIICHPSVRVIPETEADLIEIMRDTEQFPSPVRPMGSRHSITPCMSARRPGPVAGSDLWGTAVDMTGLREKFEIDRSSETLTVGAGQLYRDVALQLEKQDWQFHVNTEIGSLSMGAAACGATKDSSFPGEFGQVGSYAVAMKLVMPPDKSGKVKAVWLRDPRFKVSPSSSLSRAKPDPDFKALRSSYGLFGIVSEVTFRIKKLEYLSLTHEKLRLDQFKNRCKEWKDDAAFLYLFPHANTIVVERRHFQKGPCRRQRFRLRLRNFAWRWFTPWAGRLLGRLPWQTPRDIGLRFFGWFLRIFLVRILNIKCASPTDQIVNFKKPAKPFTFSMWAFPEDKFPQILKDYFEFCEQYRKDFGYRTNMPDASYRINQDDSSLLSYSHDHTVWTLDPVSTGVDRRWRDFLERFNKFCSDNGGTPLFNQTPFLTRDQAKKAFKGRLEKFERIRQRFDPNDRMLNEYFFQRLR